MKKNQTNTPNREKQIDRQQLTGSFSEAANKARQSGPDWQEEMIAEMVQILKGLYYEDFLFFYKFLSGYAGRKQIIGYRNQRKPEALDPKE